MDLNLNLCLCTACVEESLSLSCLRLSWGTEHLGLARHSLQRHAVAGGRALPGDGLDHLRTPGHTRCRNV